ncbi:MAG: MoaD/ThiS family protein [Dokdonella sp.]|nr:MoaD/ThiS family protein [Dokdonella sp.]MCB1577062.1 MoaD/ThiS family protein [Xanthomonadales bacterium]
MNYQLLYFASLADRAGCAGETVQSDATGLSALYDELRVRHGFAMDPARLRVAVNGQIVDWSHALADGDEVVFLPPVSGG